MSVAITIRNVPDEVRNVLAARAAASGRSLQEFLLRELIETASRSTASEVIARHRERMAHERWPSIPPDAIVDALRADRDDPRR